MDDLIAGQGCMTCNLTAVVQGAIERAGAAEGPDILHRATLPEERVCDKRKVAKGRVGTLKWSKAYKRRSNHLTALVYEIGSSVGSSQSAKVPQDSVLPEKRLKLCSKERIRNVVLDASYHLTTVVNAVCESVGATEISEIDDLSVSPEDRPSNRGTKERIE